MKYSSSTKEVPATGLVPNHVAIIMDGNGRWATKRFLPRVAGHVKGVDAVRGIVEACIKRGIQYLTLFAFSSENWRRPAEEVSLLMRLFVTALEKEVRKMHDNNIRLKIVGDLTRFDLSLQDAIREAESKTSTNTGLTVTVCANYGGRWDIVQAANRLIAEGNSEREITEDDLAGKLSMAYAPEPDLFIRTGGETRISNFLLWQLAYTEFYFTDTYWPDFDAKALDLAIQSYQARERRFGRTSEQLTTQS
ncbi:di-trans,poly-cis-decaprenylcistransferase [Undibacterium sp. LX40W]|uniref:Isoprenyl transferase n=1 Tax=Undibacterium nitidum TaxID=2762298 RepID=A0A923KS38_9BURK|nr:MULTISPECIES: polyprenyl diphosphate synthase [Undibacterium]MBC3880049.1 di-trans,poly-cis-decaprenylcistransferase [Undibacterium nitidum]MBC3891215.1 di-trans,poly-cis-decaprenylcistransferase [Undibacterium sp. LX40W]